MFCGPTQTFTTATLTPTTLKLIEDIHMEFNAAMPYDQKNQACFGPPQINCGSASSGSSTSSTVEHFSPMPNDANVQPSPPCDQLINNSQPSVNNNGLIDNSMGSLSLNPQIQEKPTLNESRLTLSQELDSFNYPEGLCESNEDSMLEDSNCSEISELKYQASNAAAVAALAGVHWPSLPYSNGKYAPNPANGLINLTPNLLQYPFKGNDLNLNHQPHEVQSNAAICAMGKQKRGSGRKPTNVKEEHLSPEEEERRKVRRERNKLAAARCRKRRVDHTNSLLGETQKLEIEKRILQEELVKLQRQAGELTQMLNSHDCCVCH